jgi:hypothetical protein
MTELEITVTIEEGDILKFNDVWWKIDDLTEPFGQKADMTPMNTGEFRCLGKEEIEDRIDFSGNFQLVREDYQSVTDY